MVTSRDVAKAAGVSQTTVSRVLNGSDLVKPATRERVLAALQDYEPNAQARAMRTNRTQAIGVVAANITNPYFPELVEAIYAAARRRNLTVLLWSDPDPGAAAALEGVRRGLVDGVCVATVTASAGVQSLLETKIPLVLVNRGIHPQVTDQVLSNSEQIGTIAAKYLLGNGRREIGLIFGPSDVGAINDRRDAFLRTLAASGVSVPSEWSERGPATFSTGYNGVQRMFSSAHTPSTVFCSNDLLAFGAKSALQKLNLRVPEDVWVMGVDDLPMASWEVFDLTTLRQPVELMAEEAINLLSKRIEGDRSDITEVLLDVELIVRGSTNHTEPVS